MCVYSYYTVSYLKHKWHHGCTFYSTACSPFFLFLTYYALWRSFLSHVFKSNSFFSLHHIAFPFTVFPLYLALAFEMAYSIVSQHLIVSAFMGQVETSISFTAHWSVSKRGRNIRTQHTNTLSGGEMLRARTVLSDLLPLS